MNNRFGVKPFGRQAVYATAWAGNLTFEEIEAQLRPLAANMLLRQYRVWAQDLDDCLQNGLMALWQALVADPDYLAMVTKFDTALKICHRSKAACIYRQRLRYDSIEDMLAKSSLKHADERSITGFEREKVSGEPYAAWATLLDLRMDLEQAILTVYEQVKDNPADLLGLYIATTEVMCKDVAHILRRTGEETLRRRSLVVRDQLRTLLADHGKVTTCWRDKFQKGEVMPAQKVLAACADNQIMAQAIQSLLDGRTGRKASKDYGYNVNTFDNYRKKANKRLAVAYSSVA